MIGRLGCEVDLDWTRVIGFLGRTDRSPSSNINYQFQILLPIYVKPYRLADPKENGIDSFWQHAASTPNLSQNKVVSRGYDLAPETPKGF